MQLDPVMAAPSPLDTPQAIDAAPSGACSANPAKFADGHAIPDFNEGGSCGVTHAWKIDAVDGIAFSQTATINCAMANGLNTWFDQVVQPAAKEYFGQRVVKVTVLDSYACRSRNNVRGAKLSEHAHGNAIDIASFIFADGHEAIVERDYSRRNDDGAFLRRVHDKACGVFNTVLGPDADAYHDNHIHVDLQPLRPHRFKFCH